VVIEKGLCGDKRNLLSADYELNCKLYMEDLFMVDEN
jgi:hypothetical protein